MDADALHETYLRRVRDRPSTGAEEEAPDEALLNEAYETLRDPCRRLAHLLSLGGRSPARQSPLDPELMDLFSRLAPAIQSADELLRETRASSSPLARALLAERQMQTQADLQHLLREVEEVRETRLARLADLHPQDLDGIETAHGELSFLAKWNQQLRERVLEFLSLE